MSDESSRGTLRLVLRGFTIADAAPASSVGNDVFVPLRKPPPVGSVLEAFSGDSRQLLQVTRVVESEGEGRTPGFFGREREDDEDGRLLERVGSERLAPASAGQAAQLGAQAEEAEEAAPSYAVPAPVLDPEPSEPIDVRDEGDATAGEAGAASDDGDDGESAGASGDAPKARGKKRKGRKRG